MYKICINIKSFKPSYIKRSILKINEILFFLKKTHIKIIGLPIKKKLYTVLKSPHKDKKSREQFQLKRWKSKIIIELDSKTKITNLFLFLLKNSEFPGVEMQIFLIKKSYI